MRHFLQMAGRIVWWCAWPVLWFRLHGSRRTRLVLTNGKGEILLVKGWISPKGLWALPGGGLKRDEEALVGLLREVQEEIGIALQATDVIPLEPRQLKSKGFQSQLYCFTAHLTAEPALRLQRFEIAEAAWINPALLTADMAEPDVIAILETLV